MLLRIPEALRSPRRSALMIPSRSGSMMSRKYSRRFASRSCGQEHRRARVSGSVYYGGWRPTGRKCFPLTPSSSNLDPAPRPASMMRSARSLFSPPRRAAVSTVTVRSPSTASGSEAQESRDQPAPGSGRDTSEGLDTSIAPRDTAVSIFLKLCRPLRHFFRHSKSRAGAGWQP